MDVLLLDTIVGLFIPAVRRATVDRGELLGRDGTMVVLAEHRIDVGGWGEKNAVIDLDEIVLVVAVSAIVIGMIRRCQPFLVGIQGDFIVRSAGRGSGAV